jgi:hypothetical protein
VSPVSGRSRREKLLPVSLPSYFHKTTLFCIPERQGVTFARRPIRFSVYTQLAPEPILVFRSPVSSAFFLALALFSQRIFLPNLAYPGR